MVSERLSSFLFEIASAERLRILESLAEKPLRHAEIARSLRITGSETTRHLNRLTTTGLVAKNPAGRYEPTRVARALLVGLPFLEFLVEHRSYLERHDLGALDASFVRRVGELSRARVIDGTYAIVGLQEAALRSAARRIWVVTEQRFEQGLPILSEKADGGRDVRVVRSRPLLEEEERVGPPVRRSFPLRVLPRVPLFLAVVDDAAGLCLPSSGGPVDMGTMLYLTDRDGCRWAEELFLSLWERSETPRLTPGGRARSAP